MHRRFLALALSALIGLAPVSEAFAKPGSGGFSSRSSSGGYSSRSSSSGGFSSRSSSSGGFSSGSSYRTSSPSSGGYSYGSRPSSGGFSSGGGYRPRSQAAPVAIPPPSTRDSAVNRQISADAYSKSRTARSSDYGSTYAPGGGSSYRYRDQGDLRSARTTYVTRNYHNYYIPPSYGYNAYGSWSNTFMTLMMYDALFGYNHRSDPNYQQWRSQADIQAQTDAQLRAQLQTLDAKVAQLQASGQRVDPTYVPSNVPPEVMYADGAPPQAQAQRPQTSSNQGGGIFSVMLWTIVILAIVGSGVWFIFFRRRPEEAGYRY